MRNLWCEVRRNAYHKLVSLFFVRDMWRRRAARLNRLKILPGDVVDLMNSALVWGGFAHVEESGGDST